MKNEYYSVIINAESFATTVARGVGEGVILSSFLRGLNGHKISAEFISAMTEDAKGCRCFIRDQRGRKNEVAAVLVCDFLWKFAFFRRKITSRSFANRLIYDPILWECLFVIFASNYPRPW